MADLFIASLQKETDKRFFYFSFNFFDTAALDSWNTVQIFFGKKKREYYLCPQKDATMGCVPVRVLHVWQVSSK